MVSDWRRNDHSAPPQTTCLLRKQANHLEASESSDLYNQ
ncbi:hypothetical protein SynBIOSU31_01933 [Synechococcus sp. BIOS-U3-1]|nr:hypothetical protein SynBIOSU31_01933 [Synechococcus sp. BIOS-U3-1]